MEQRELWLLVGLGNPGRRYQGNRHNVGFMVADGLGDRAGLEWQSSARFDALLTRGTLEGHDVMLVKPQTFMNLSGTSVGPLARFYRVPPERVVAIHDDVDLALGRLKVKVGGGDGGHKGVRSMAQELGSPDFVRVRVGVGRPTVGDVTDYVLRDFEAHEREDARAQIERAGQAALAVVCQGTRAAMNSYNAEPSAREKEEEARPEEKRRSENEP